MNLKNVSGSKIKATFDGHIELLPRQIRHVVREKSVFKNDDFVCKINYYHYRLKQSSYRFKQETHIRYLRIHSTYHRSHQNLIPSSPS
jgi:hypothetical protein